MGNPKEGFFTIKDSVCYTGTHLLLELWDAKRLNSFKYVEKTLAQAVKAAKATLLEIRLHQNSFLFIYPVRERSSLTGFTLPNYIMN